MCMHLSIPMCMHMCRSKASASLELPSRATESQVQALASSHECTHKQTHTHMHMHTHTHQCALARAYSPACTRASRLVMHARMQGGHAQVSCMRAACMRAFVRRVQRRCLLRCWHQTRCRHPKRSQDQTCTTRGRSACHHQASCRCQIEFCTAASKFHCDLAALLQLLYRV